MTQRSVAQRRFLDTAKQLGWRPNVNLNRLKTNEINSHIEQMLSISSVGGEGITRGRVADASLKSMRQLIKRKQGDYVVYTRQTKQKITRNRSLLIKNIKSIDSTYRSSKTDTYEDLSREYRRRLAPLPFLQSINNYKINGFLNNPVDEASITIDAKKFVNALSSMQMQTGFYLVMTTTSTLTNEDGQTTDIEEYKVVSNIEQIKELLSIISSNDVHTQAITIGHGSDTELVYDILKYKKKIKLTWYSIDSYRRVHSGAYFKYYNNTILDLSRYQIFKSTDYSKEEDSINCLIYTFMMSGKVNKNDLDNLKLALFHKEVKASDLKKIALRLGITIKLRYDPKQSAYVFNKGHEEVCIGLVDNHYFLNEPTNITKFALDNYEKVINDPTFPTIKPKRYKTLTSYQVINTIFTSLRHLLTPITLNNITNKQCTEKLMDYDELRAPKVICGCTLPEFVDCYKNEGRDCGHMFCRVKTLMMNCPCNSKAINHEFKDYGYLSMKVPFKGIFKDDDTNPNNNYDLWFVDTETFIQKEKKYHVAFSLCAIKYNQKTDTFQEFAFYGLDCVEQFLKQCVKNHSIIYAHNMAFDFRVFIDHLYDLQSPIETGTKLKQIQGKLHDGYFKDKKGKMKKSFKNVLFKDSYSFLPVKLSELPAMLDLPTGDKEVFPYTLINESNFDQHVSISECRKHIKQGNRKAFMLNAKKIGAYDEVSRTVDMKLYTLNYCMQDTRILAHGFIKFRKQIQEVCKLDIIPRVSLPQLADDFLKSKGVYDDCFSISGIAQDFIRRCCVGGRVMTNENQKWHVKVMKDYTMINDIKVMHHQKTYSKGEVELIKGAIVESMNTGTIADFDAVSLYPSAMSMMKGYVKGLPQVLNEEEIEHFEGHKVDYDAYYVEIEVLSHSIDREFPLQSIKSKDGIRNFTNDIDGQRFYVDNIALEDLIEFHGITYKVIRGYYYMDGYNNKIVETINFMFNERLRLKKEGNNLQNVYKLLMNASYGKLIQKAIKKSKKFVTASELRKYVAKKHKFIESYRKINDNLFVITENKSTVEHLTACHIAANILSMSKRLMNRVMCLAEDNSIKIYYQDTDSMHLHEQAIPTLSDAFEKKYNTKLIGKAMGQFHTDFSVGDSSATNIRAVESIFLGKKCYIDKLKYSNKYLNDKYDYHIRVKGIPTQSIKDFDADYMKTYGRLLNGESLDFDMSAYCPLQIDTDYRARANTKCISRRLQFK